MLHAISEENVLEVNFKVNVFSDYSAAIAHSIWLITGVRRVFDESFEVAKYKRNQDKIID